MNQDGLLLVLLNSPFSARAAQSSGDRSRPIAAHQINPAKIESGPVAAHGGHTDIVRLIGRTQVSGRIRSAAATAEKVATPGCDCPLGVPAVATQLHASATAASQPGWRVVPAAQPERKEACP